MGISANGNCTFLNCIAFNCTGYFLHPMRALKEYNLQQNCYLCSWCFLSVLPWPGKLSAVLRSRQSSRGGRLHRLVYLKQSSIMSCVYMTSLRPHILSLLVAVYSCEILSPEGTISVVSVPSEREHLACRNHVTQYHNGIVYVTARSNKGAALTCTNKCEVVSFGLFFFFARRLGYHWWLCVAADPWRLI